MDLMVLPSVAGYSRGHQMGISSSKHQQCTRQSITFVRAGEETEAPESSRGSVGNSSGLAAEVRPRETALSLQKTSQ